LDKTVHGIYDFVQYVNIVSTDQEMMCSIQFQSFLIFFSLPDGLF